MGALFQPLATVSEEGTGQPYPYKEADRDRDTKLEAGLHAWLNEHHFTSHKGPLWSTDAPLRETPDKISAYRENGVLAVEMEYAALRAVAAFRRIQLAALFTVSDELFHETWRPAFTDQAFRRVSQDNLIQLCTFFGEKHI